MLVCSGSGASGSSDRTPLGALLTSLRQRHERSVIQIIAHRPVGPCPAAAEGIGPSRHPEPSLRRLWSSGVVVDEEGRILTCADGAQPGDSLEIRLPDGRRCGGRFLAQDVRSGVAMIQALDAQNLRPALEPLEMPPLTGGDWMLLLSFGGPDGLSELDLARLEGEGPHAPELPYLGVALGAGQGSCGGAVLDGKGGFRGMVVDVPVGQDRGMLAGGCPESVSALLDRGKLRALSREGMLPILARLRHAEVARVGFLGVQAEVDPEWLASMGGAVGSPGSNGTPIRVVRVLAGSPAEVGGLLVGDQILEIDGEAMKEVFQVTNKIAATPPGSLIHLKVLRQGAPLELSPRIGDRSSLDWMERQTTLNLSRQKAVRRDVQTLEEHLKQLEQFRSRYQ